MAQMRTLKLSTGQETEKTSVSDPGEIDDLVSRLGPELPFFTLVDKEWEFVQAVHYASAVTGPNADKSAGTYAVECSTAPNMVHQTYMENTDEIASFMKSWASNSDDWQATIEQWKVIDFKGRSPQGTE